MWCCQTNVLKADGKYRKSVFDKKEIDSLRRKFNYVSGNQEYINRQTFKKNIGYLGIRAVTSFLDRIFNSFDIDQDNKISLDDFIEYMQILKDGTDDQKARISFNLIYMEEIIPQKKQRRSSFNKSNQGPNHINKIRPQKNKIIDVAMFQKFFQDFYKSWSSITNQSIAKDTKLALKKFIQELFRKVQTDGRKAIDLDYYKMLYKDRQFMMAFRQINSKLGNFFIKSTNNEFQKNVTLIHKILKKIHSLFDKCFPLMNDSFLQDIQKNQKKSGHQTTFAQNIHENQNQQMNFQHIDKYYYDAKRYEFENIFETKQHARFQFKQNQKSSSPLSNGHKQNNSQHKGLKSKFKELFNQENVSEFSYEQNPLYKKGLQDHVAFLQKKLLFIENVLKQIIEQSKQMYNEMHQQFVKILQRIQRQQHLKQSQMKQFNYSKQFIPKQHQTNHNLNGNDKNTPQNHKQRQKKDNNGKSDTKVFFGDKNFNLVLQIMVGIQMSVRSVSGFQQIIFQEPQDFHLKHTFEMDYGHFGENDILYTFTDYAPNVFNHIRKIYEIQNENYINSIGPNKMMSALIMGRMASFQQLVSEGKSGSFFYHTEDGKYLIKTISQKQFYFMRKILEKYFRHIKTNPQTLMPRFFGLHKITSTMKRDYSKNIVMNNFFNTTDRITDKYDLKGSWVNRQNTSGQGVKKDMNFIKEKKRIDIDKAQKVKIYQIIQKDAKFFADNNILDYSLLVGYVQSIQMKKSKIPRAHSLFDIGNEFLFQSAERQKSVHILDQKKSMNFKFKSQNNRNSFYLLGIIDILTQYNSKKQAEHLFKSCIYDSKGISAVPPEQYKDRFLKFLKDQVFRIGKKPPSKEKSKSKTNLPQTNQKDSKSKGKKKAHSQNQSNY